MNEKSPMISIASPFVLRLSSLAGWPVEPVRREELGALAKEVIIQPPDVVKRLKKLLGE